MPLKKMHYRVWLTGDDTDSDGRLIEVSHADTLRAELEAKRQGLSADPRENPMHASSLWVWASLVRTGDTAEKFRPFIDAHLIGFNEAKGDADVDPTQTATESEAEPSSYASPSPQPSQAPATGSPTSPSTTS